MMRTNSQLDAARWAVLLVALSSCGGPGRVPEDPVARQWCAAITTSREAGERLAAPGATIGPVDLATAWSIQTWLATRGGDRDPVVGWKVAFTSAAAQARWNVETPLAGPILRSQLVPVGATCDAGDWHDLFLEGELAVTLARDVDQPVADALALRDAVATLHVAIELPDLEFDPAFPVTAADLVATGVGGRRFCVGRGLPLGALDAKHALVEMTLDGRPVYAGPASATLGGPLESLRWLANELLAHGLHLRAGDVVLLGSVDAPRSSRDGAVTGRWRARAGNLPGAWVEIAEAP